MNLFLDDDDDGDDVTSLRTFWWNCECCRRREKSVSSGHVRLHVEPRHSSASVPAAGAGLRRSTQLSAGRGREQCALRRAHLRPRPVRVRQRRLHPAAVALRPRQRLRGQQRRTVQLQYAARSFLFVPNSQRRGLWPGALPGIFVEGRKRSSCFRDDSSMKHGDWGDIPQNFLIGFVKISLVTLVVDRSPDPGRPD